MLALLLAGCAGVTPEDRGTSAGDAPPAASEPRAAEPSPTPLPRTPWVADAWLRAADSGAVAGVYFRFINPATRAVTLTGVASPAARIVSLHETMDHDGMAHMAAAGPRTIAPGDSLVARPGGLHVMLTGLLRPLAVGDSVPIGLLVDGDTLTVQARVRAPDGMPVAGEVAGRVLGALPDTAAPACVADGRWQRCTLEERLRNAGLVPHPASDTVPVGLLPVPGEAWRLGRRLVHAHLFADSSAAIAAVAAIDSVGVRPRGDTAPMFDEPPVLLRGANVVLLLFGAPAVTVERVSNALLGGPPQPAR